MYRKQLSIIFMLAIIGVLSLFPVCAVAEPNTSTEAGQNADKKKTSVEKRLEEDRQRIDRVLGTGDKSNFTPHKLNYGIIGVDDALMQFSFKYRVVRDWGMYMAFTNVVKWDIYGDSTPYYDINFMPELFYRFTPKREWLLSLDAGYWHNSNGQAGEKDRAWDQLFARFNKTFKYKHTALAWETNVYYELGTNKANRDIDEYLGWWDTGVYLLNILPTDGNNIDLEFFMWSGENGVPFKPGQFRAGIIYKLKHAAFQPSFYLQYFNGYGEVILDHNVQTESWRIGLAFSY